MNRVVFLGLLIYAILLAALLTLHGVLLILIIPLGLYLLVLESVVLLAVALGTSHFAPYSRELLLTLIQILAWGGYSLGLFGAVILMRHRLSEKRLKLFSTAAHYFNLLLLGAIFASGLLWIATDAGYAAHLIAAVAGLSHPGQELNLPGMGQWNFGLTLFLFFYFPFTHMTHAVLKYFIVRGVRIHAGRGLTGQLEAYVTSPDRPQRLTGMDPPLVTNVNPPWPETGNDRGKKP